MYQPRHFAETRPEVLLGLIRDHPLATVITGGEDGLTADPIPMLHVPGHGAHGVLRGHVARANPLWQRAGRDGIECLVVFNGPDGYVSPSWYPSKAEHHKVVPTWNYAVVQARGRLVAHDDPRWLHAFVTGLTDRHEAGRPAPWATSDAPPEFIDTMLKAIVGIELEVRDLVGKFKLGQNRSAADRDGVVTALAADPRHETQALHRMMTGPL